MAVQGVLPRTQTCVLVLLCLSGALPDAPISGTNYYDALSVDTTATDSQIKKAFRKLAVKYHPDKSKSADAEKTFREIVEAYRVLTNKDKRRLYDRVGHEAFLNNPDFADTKDETNVHFSFSDFFHDFNDSPFEEGPHFHWSFPQEWEDEDSLNEHNNFEGPGFSFYFGNEDENEDDFLY